MTRPFSQATIDLSPDDLKKINDLKVGGKVRFVLYGTLREVSLRQADTSKEGAADEGVAVVEVSNLKLASNNEIAELFDEEFDG